MRILFAGLAATALIAGSALAHDHDKDKKSTDSATHADHHEGYGSSNSYGSSDSYGSSTAYGPGHDEHTMMSSKTMPADGAVLDHSPAMIGVDFGHVMLVKGINLTTLTGERIELDLSGIDETSHVMVKVPELQPDDYVVDWRARGHDGHVMSGSFAFTVE